MGQQAVVLMYGVKKSDMEVMSPSGDDYFWDDIRQPREKRLTWKDERQPRSAYDGDVFGFAVAAGPATNDDEGFLGDTVAIAELDKVHGAHIQRAKERWTKFAQWAKEQHGKDLPEPRLYLTTDERA